MIGAKVSGIPDLRAALKGIAPKLRVRALRNALAAGARVVQKAARAATPVISASAPAVLRGHRKPGTVRKAISVRTSKLARRKGDVGVFVNVRPAKKGSRGAKNPNDPFYWRFLEFGTAAHSRGSKSRYTSRSKLITRKHRRGTGATKAFKFLQTGAGKLPEALAVFLREIRPQIAKLNKPKAPAP
jgi:HK97 gp10 family phage protein